MNLQLKMYVVFSLAYLLCGCKSKHEKRVENLIVNIRKLKSELIAKNITSIESFNKIKNTYMAYQDSDRVLHKIKKIDPKSIQILGKEFNEIDSLLEIAEVITTHNSNLNNIKGYYEGSGGFTYEISGWGRVKAGSVETSIDIDTGRSEIVFVWPGFLVGSVYHKSKTEIFEFEVIDLKELSEKKVVGYFKAKKSHNTFCSFEWSPGKINIEGQNYYTENLLKKVHAFKNVNQGYDEQTAKAHEEEAALAQASADSASAMLNTKAEGFKKNMAKSKRNH